MSNDGVNLSERYLGGLCRSTFLSLWSYQGIFRDQGRGKEICDLLVVFGNHILIFSDKSCKFPNSGNLRTDWKRWFKKAIAKSADQIWGAERWIKKYPDRVFLDPECTRRLPIDLPPVQEMRIHRIAVAHGAAVRCRRYIGGRGSLMIDTSLVGNDHYLVDEEYNPFTVGILDASKGYVHVLDDVSLDIVLKTLDTVSDFVTYLEKKEALIKDYPLFAAGEEDLLGHYVQNMNPDDEYDFVAPDKGITIAIPEGFWDNFFVSPERKVMIKANEISYGWDALIEKLNSHIAANTHHFSNHPGDINANERIVRFMAAESRTQRRKLAKEFYTLQLTTPRTHKAAWVHIPHNTRSPFYVFVVLPELDFVDYEDYRQVRRELLMVYCRVTKAKCPNALDIVGIATESGLNEYSSEDVVYFDARNWCEEDQTSAEQLGQKLELFKNSRIIEVSEKTYPDRPRYGRDAKHKSGKTPRNAPCPCGSGNKYKKCCMRNSE